MRCRFMLHAAAAENVRGSSLSWQAEIDLVRSGAVLPYCRTGDDKSARNASRYARCYDRRSALEV